MESILYAEVYLICMIISGLLLFWTGRREFKSAEAMWFRRMLICFALNFTSNFLFTVFNGICVIEGAVDILSYTFKTGYFITLVLGVFFWCGYVETMLHNRAFWHDKRRVWLIVPVCAALAMPIVNLFTHHMFDFDVGHAYRRNALFLAEMVLLFCASAACSAGLLKHARREADPTQVGHLRLVATFPLCLLAAIVLSFLGESVPVICVCLAVELLCLYMGSLNRQISIDKLTQVNNRQNLIGFMNYKLKNHSGELFLLMIDLDDFKSINDTYGHLEGDDALVCLSGVLKRACGPFARRPYIARYGGDEFIIMMEGNQSDVDALKKSIHDGLEAVRTPERPYTISVSIGCARYEGGMDYKALIAAADEELYRHKRARKGR